MIITSYIEVVIFILEKISKIFCKVVGIMMALFGVRYLLSFLGLIIPIEWFVIMGCGMVGMYGIVFIIIYIFFIKMIS